MVALRQLSIFVLLCFLLLKNFVIAQTDTQFSGDEMVFTGEDPPEYKGGHEKLKDLIQSNVKHYFESNKDKLIGTVYIEFIVDTTGNTIHHKILKSVNEELDQEALRITKLIKFEKPALQRNKPVSVKMSIPINFKKVFCENFD